jgi:RNA polymerase sigma-70 factor, ECF subfamily
MAASDRELVARAQAGDAEAFGELVTRYRDMVYGLCYHLTQDFEAARDLAQEAFVQAYVKLGQLRGPERFAGWLRRIATNSYRSGRRRREVATVALEAAEDVEVRPPSELEVVVREALGRLRPPERLALTLHYVDGYSQAEIARFLNVRPETVKTRLARARTHLREDRKSVV